MSYYWFRRDPASAIPKLGLSLRSAMDSCHDVAMGWWFGEPALLPGEEVLWHQNANREQSSLRQVGGRLFVTPWRMLFWPNRFDDATGGSDWSCSLNDVNAVRVEPSRVVPPFLGLTAKLRRRLRVELATGVVELFVVNRVDETVTRLQEVIDAAKKGQTP